MSKKVVIVGGGIVGYSTAHFLVKDGHEVTILEKSAVPEGCSYGNAGMVVPSHVIPLAAPGIVQQGIKWLFKNDSPFHIKPRLNLDLINWLIQLTLKANRKNVTTGAPVLAQLSNYSRVLHEQMNQELGDNYGFSGKGLMMLYKTNEAEIHEKEAAELASQVGVDTQILSPQEVQSLDPGTTYDVLGGVYYPNDAFLSPERMMESLRTNLLNIGAEIRWKSEVSEILIDRNRIKSIAVGPEKMAIEADEYVICAGLDSSALAKQIGIRIPMQGGKGYSINVATPSSLPNICSILLEARVAVTPMRKDLRLAGTLEISNDLSVRQSRFHGYLKRVGDYMPDFPYGKIKDNHEVWSGLRPCSPDGLPYIGRTKAFENLLFGTGHAMLGLSLGPGTGKILSDIISGANTPEYLNTVNPDRYC